MSTPTVSPSPTSVESSRPLLPLHRRLSFWAFASLVVLAVAFYVWWGLTAPSPGLAHWFDNGVYAVTIVLALFGLTGMCLVTPNPPAPPPPHP